MAADHMAEDLAGQRVLVTGADGFIGSHLCQALLKQGRAVRGIDAFTDSYDPERKRQNLAGPLAHPSFELVVGDLLTVGLAEVLDGVDAVVTLMKCRLGL